MVIPFSDGFCGGLCMVNVLHLVHDPIQILKECWRILSTRRVVDRHHPTDYNLPDNWRIPSEKEYFKTVLKRVFSSVEFSAKKPHR
jgi:SAM-dependent methyltransferase